MSTVILKEFFSFSFLFQKLARVKSIRLFGHVKTDAGSSSASVSQDCFVLVFYRIRLIRPSFHLLSPDIRRVFSHSNTWNHKVYVPYPYHNTIFPHFHHKARSFLPAPD